MCFRITKLNRVITDTWESTRVNTATSYEVKSLLLNRLLGLLRILVFLKSGFVTCQVIVRL
jgi:hypothetical protein